MRDEPHKEPSIPEPGLHYEPLTENMDLDVGEMTSSTLNPLPGNDEQKEATDATQTAQSLIGAWSGAYRYGESTASDGTVGFSITQHTPDGRFQCSGVDVWGHFTVKGRVNGERITFLKEYVERQGGYKVSWRYIGKLNEDWDEMSGGWGPPAPDDDDESLVAESESSNEPTEPGEHEEMEGKESEENTGDATSADVAPAINIEPPTPKEDEGDVTKDGASDVGSTRTSAISDATDTWQLGTFVMYRRPADYLLYRPSEEEFLENKSRALWKLVRNVAKYWFRQRHITWDAIREKRHKRLIYMELSEKRLQHMNIFDNPQDEARWLELVNTVHPVDLNLWQNIAQFKRSREPIHS